jgi:probable HAF family extracellular repeat protein
MWYPSLLRVLIPGSAGAGRIHSRAARRETAARRLQLESLEDRWCPSYSITDLGTLGGATSQANAINISGHVAGSAQIASGSYHPFLYSGGVMTDLGIATGFTDGSAWAVNDAGQVAVSEGVGGNLSGDAFLWESGSGLTDLGKINGSPTIPLGINNAVTNVHPVQIVGTGGDAWIWQKGGVMTDLNTLLPPHSGWVLTEADGINDSQQIVGQGTINGQYHASLWQIGSGVPTDLGTLPGVANSGAKAINNSSQVAGWSNTPPPNQDHAVTWISGQINDLGALPGDNWSSAAALNNSSPVQVVGSSYHFPSYRAVLWQNGNATDLNSQLPRKSGWTLEYAYGVNDSGLIVGQGVHSGGTHAFLLTPGGRSPAVEALSSGAILSSSSIAPSSPVPVSAPFLVSATVPDPAPTGWQNQAPPFSVGTSDRGGTSMLSASRTSQPDRWALEVHDRVFAAFADELVPAWF